MSAVTERGPGRLRRDERAVSVTVGYVLNLAVASLLLTGLFVAGGSFVQSEREAAVEGELTVVGERFVADLMTVDRLANASDHPSDPTVERRVELPSRVSGLAYRLTIETGEAGTDVDVLRLESEGVDVVVELPFRTSEAVAATTVDGGDVTIRWDPTGGPGGDGAVVIES
ncbi:DUF7266 family protein [Halorubrum sp. DTA98]|uniref:DUF7266 family protein n=1 Tax=Halorubrum sp. DTA98 TaxID=3402163 RepID=UPI003AAA2426